ncbi:hypothetical protein LPJ66_000641 [Kickxella alabastrina]|uniref:Uncharacterized protein n=1 Tax=Kickxella alabastrina TaxID=61397 RepID=A0ACC1IVK7_9FUNG|nr:hypothetical protein LPJ66_000641 [Kickxella alabastrina]
MTPKLIEGRLEVQVVSGRELPRRSLFGRRDSAVELLLGTSTRRTQVDKKGGSSPQWNDRVSFIISGHGKTQMQVQALEIESSISSKVIGSCVIDLNKVFVEEEVDGWYTLKYQDKSAGDVYLELTFTPKGGRKRLPKDPLADEDENPVFHTEPKVKRMNDAIASAPSLLHDAPPMGDAKPSPQMLSASAIMPITMRPSMSDMRPYSSASMHNPDLANKYANKHGIKPLPPAPTAASLPMGGAVLAGLQSSMGGYDQTILPGQVPFANQQQQPQRLSYGSETSTMYPQSQQMIPGASMALAHMQQGQQQQQQEPALMNLFAPPTYIDDNTSMAPSAQPYNPAFNPTFAATGAEHMMQTSAPAKHLPLPPGQAVTGVPMVMMMVDSNGMVIGQQQMMSPPYGNEYQMEPMQMMASGYAYAQVPVSTPDMMNPNQHQYQQQQFMTPQQQQHEMYESPMPMQQSNMVMPQQQVYPQQQYVQHNPQFVQQQQQQFVQQPMQMQPMVGYAQPGYQQMAFEQQQPVYTNQTGVVLEPSAPMMIYDNAQGQYMHPQQYANAPGTPYSNQAY